MNWTRINEFFNVLAIATGMIPVAIAVFMHKKSIALSWIVGLLTVVTVLDIVTFIYYKFWDDSIHWLSPLYMLTILVFIPLYFYFSTKQRTFRGLILILQSIVFSSIAIKLLFFAEFNNYDQWSWLGIQMYVVSLCLVHFFFIVQSSPTRLAANAEFFITLGLFMMFFVPMLSSFIQRELYDTSPDYYQMSLIILNISSAIAYIIVARGVYYVKPKFSS